MVGARWSQVRNFSLLHSLKVGYETRPASYSMETGNSFSGTRRLGGEADHSLPSGAEINNMQIYTSAPSCVYVVSSLIKRRDFTFKDTTCADKMGNSLSGQRD